MATKASIRQARYDASHCKIYRMKLNIENDKDIIAKLSTVSSMQGYIKQLIRENINGTVSVPFSNASLELLKEKANKQGISVSVLISVMVNEQLIRT